MKNELMRFSVAMPVDLLMQFDQLVARRGLAKNRSEVVRDLVREALVADECALPGTIVMGTLTIVYNHHESDVQEKINVIQHTYSGMVVSSLHVHLDEENCLEVIVLRGETTDVHDLSDMILGTKGVKNGGLVTTTVNTDEPLNPLAHAHSHKGGHTHSHSFATAVPKNVAKK